MTKPIACLRAICPHDLKCWEAEKCLHPMTAALSPEPTEGQPKTTGTVHDLKVWPDYFDDVESGKKPFEVRLNNRDFQIGDILLLREWSYIGDGSMDGKYSGRETRKIITYVLAGAERFGVQDKFVVLGIAALRPVPLQDRSKP